MLNRKVCRKSWRTCCLFLSAAARPVGPYSEDLWASQYPKRLGSGNAKECERNERNPDRRYPAHPSRLSIATRLLNKCFRIISMTECQLDTISNQAPPMQVNILKQVWKSSKEFLLLRMVAILQIKTNEETFKHFTTGQKKVKHSNWNSFGWTSFSGSLLSSMLGVNLRKLKCNVDLNKSGTIWPLYAHYRVTSGFTNSFRFRTNTTLDHPVHEAIWMHEPTSRDWLERLGLSATAGADPGRGVLSRGPGNQNCIKKTVVTLYRDE